MDYLTMNYLKKAERVDKAIKLMENYRDRSNLETLRDWCAEWISDKFYKDFKKHGLEWIEARYRVDAWKYEPETEIAYIYTWEHLHSKKFKDVFYKFFMKIVVEKLSNDIKRLNKKMLLERYYDPMWLADDGSDLIDKILEEAVLDINIMLED